MLAVSELLLDTAIVIGYLSACHWYLKNNKTQQQKSSANMQDVHRYTWVVLFVKTAPKTEAKAMRIQIVLATTVQALIILDRALLLKLRIG